MRNTIPWFLSMWVVKSSFLFSILLDCFALTQRIPSLKTRTSHKHLTIKDPVLYQFGFTCLEQHIYFPFPNLDPTSITECLLMKKHWIKFLDQRLRSQYTCKIIVGPYLSPWPSVDYSSLRDCLCIRVCNAIEFVLEKRSKHIWNQVFD